MNNIHKVFKALSDETRIKILIMISRRVVCQRGISKHLQISESAVSQHLKVLKEADILAGYKDGYFVFYKINYDIFNECISFMDYLGGSVDYAFKYDNQITYNCSGACKGNKKCCKKGEEV